MRSSLSVVLVLLCLTIRAQDSTKHANIMYSNSFSSGALFDSEKNITGSLSVINGIKWRQWRMGAGVGFDGYEDWRVFPIFASFAFDFNNKGGNSLFLQFNCGHSFAQFVPVDYWGGFESHEDKGGLMINPMIGYRIVQGKMNFFISIGHKFQKASYFVRSTNEWYPWEYETTRDFNRFFVQLGFGFQ